MKDVYRVIMTADLHISNKLPYAKPIDNGITDRLLDAIRVVERINKFAKKKGADAIFILGDTFDRSLVDAVTLTHTTKAIVETTVPTYILAGNHDANSIRGGRFVVEAFGEIKHDKIHYMSENFSPRKWLNFVPMPFSTVDYNVTQIKKAKKELDRSVTNVLLFHNSVLGCNHLEWTCDDGLDVKLLTTGFNYAFGGHFHTTQFFGKKENGMYVGAPLHHNFGDRGRAAGFWVITFYKKKNKIVREFIEGNAPKFHVTNKMKLEDCWKIGDYVRVEIEATNHEWAAIKPKVKTFCDGIKGIHVTYKHKPVYHHTKRVKTKSSKSKSITMEEALSTYLKSPGVVVGSLDKKRLKRIGLNTITQVRDENGIT